MNTLIVVFVICLELLRTFFHCQDIYKLAIAKGERPLKWVLGTIAIWWPIEIGVVFVWVYVLEYKAFIIGVVVGIALARMVFYFFKKSLQEKNTLETDNMIDQIGRKIQEEEE
ncbi:MAG: hypothetical protein R3D00_03980 [Bacteroidia bacterium]